MGLHVSNSHRMYFKNSLEGGSDKQPLLCLLRNNSCLSADADSFGLFSFAEADCRERIVLGETSCAYEEI